MENFNRYSASNYPKFFSITYPPIFYCFHVEKLLAISNKHISFYICFFINYHFPTSRHRNNQQRKTYHQEIRLHIILLEMKKNSFVRRNKNPESAET